jgi:hypothetical protein
MTQTTNPFELTLQEAEKELLTRQARRSYLSYVVQTNQGYIASRFHAFLANAVQEFIETPKSAAFDILLLSVPPQFGKGHPVDTPILTTKG